VAFEMRKTASLEQRRTSLSALTMRLTRATGIFDSPLIVPGGCGASLGDEGKALTRRVGRAAAGRDEGYGR